MTCTPSVRKVSATMSSEFPFRKVDENGYTEGDNEYSHRALLHVNIDGTVWTILYPAIQYKAPESKNDFVRLLGAHIKTQQDKGWVFHKVKVLVGNKPAWEFNP